MRTTIRRLGNSQGVTIPKTVLDEAGISIDSSIDMTVDGGAIVLRRVASNPRIGWAQAAASIAHETSDDDWLDADLDHDARRELTW